MPTIKNLDLLSQGQRLKVFLVYPGEQGPFPTVLVNHGGGGMESVYEEMCLYLAEKGYIATAMTFRGFPGSQGNQEYGKGEIEDILNLVDFLKSPSSPVVPGEIGMFGYSRGALNALLACQRSSDFRAVAVWSAPVEMIRHTHRNTFIQDIIGGSPEEFPEEYYLRSPLNFVERISCPLLIIHGEEDIVIPVEHAYLLAAELKRHNKPFRFRIYPGEGHSLAQEAFLDAWQETVEFFHQHLGQNNP